MAKLKLKTEIIKEEYYQISSKDMAKKLGIDLKENEYLDCNNLLGSENDDIIIKIQEHMEFEDELDDTSYN